MSGMVRLGRDGETGCVVMTCVSNTFLSWFSGSMILLFGGLVITCFVTYPGVRFVVRWFNEFGQDFLRLVVLISG